MLVSNLLHLVTGYVLSSIGFVRSFLHEGVSKLTYETFVSLSLGLIVSAKFLKCTGIHLVAL